MAGAGGPNLVATYAAVQSNLRKQFYGDLVDLRGALLNTMSVAPHRASSLHIKMHLIDSALHMLEESKESVSNAEMAQLMNMSAKVARAVEAWRSRKLPAMQPGAPAPAPSQPEPASQLVLSRGGAGMSSPFAAMDVQHVGGACGPPAAQQPPSRAETDGTATSIASGDRWEFLSELVAGSAPASQMLPERAQSLPLLDIDWEVPEIGPSGNLDSLLGDEAAAQAAQQRIASARVAAPGAQQAPRAGAARVPSPGGLLARASKQGGDSGGGGGGESVCQPAQQQRVAVASRDGQAGGGGLTSPRSVATSCQQPEGSSNSGGGCGATPAESAGMTAGGSVGNPPAGSACPSPGAAVLDSARLSGGLAMPLSPFGSVIVQRVSPVPALGSDVGASAFGNVESLPLSGGFGGSASHSLHPPPQQPSAPSAPTTYGVGSTAGSYGGGPAAAGGSLQLSAGAGRRSMQLNSPTLVGMQHLGLADGGMAGMQAGGQSPLGFRAQGPGSAASPPLSASVSLSQQQAAAMQAAAGQLAAAQQYSHGTLHDGGSLGALLGGEDSGSYQLGLGSPFAGGGGSHQQYGAAQQGGPACSGAAGSPAGFSAVPMSNHGSMGGLTITTGSQPRIRIATSTAGYPQHTQQQLMFDVEMGGACKRSGRGPSLYGSAYGTADLDASTASLASSGRHKRKKT